MYGPFQLVNALVLTLLLSRLALWVLSKWQAGTSKILIANATSFLFVILIGVLGLVRTKLQFADDIKGYAISQVIWIVLDIRQYRKLGDVSMTPWKFK